jgi:hypothetical protein
MSKSTFRNYSKTYFFNACFDKNQLKNLISWFIKQSGEKITVDFLETIKQIGFHQATLAGVSLGLDDLQIPSQKSLLISQAKADVSLFEQESRCGNLTSVEKSQRMISTWNQTSEILRKNAVQQFKNTNQVNPVYMMAFSGARGNISQVRQLVAMRGLMADPQGVILEFPIQSNFREGLTLTEYLISCYGARKGLVDTALRTATSGYLTRRLVDAAQHVIVSTKDCGTTQGFRLRNKDLEQHLIGRVLSRDLVINQTFQLKRNQKLSPTLAKLISKSVKEVFVRSPLTCQAENSICQLCYGWNLAHGNLVTIGEAVGVIAAQSIGEPGTQLTMRTFHTGGVGVFSDQAMKYFLAPYDGIIEYTDGLPGHFVRTPHGKIVYMLKNSNNITQNIILKLKSFDTKETLYSIKKQDLPAGSILLVRQGERVKTGQVLAQSSQFKKSKQKMPESTHPVFSIIDGEIYLESMTILKQKQLSPKAKKIKKKENEIGPDIRTLKGLGGFWVFSSENQQEFHAAKTMLRPGDLVSSKSSLFQYDFYVANRTIFHRILNKSCLGLNTVDLPLEKINFHKITYSMVLKNHSTFIKQNQKNQKEFLFFNKKRLQNFLIWFPNGSVIADSGYFFNFLFYSEIKNRTTVPFLQSKNGSNSSQLSIKGKKILNNNWFHGSFFYITTNIQKWRLISTVGFEKTRITYFLNFKNSYQFTSCAFTEFCETRAFLQSKNTYAPQNKNAPKQNLLLQYNPTLNHFSSKLYFQNRKPFSEKKKKVKTKFLYCTQKNYIIYSISNSRLIFLKMALNKVKDSISSNCDFSSLFFQEKKGWIYVPITSQIINRYKTTQKLLIWEQGKIFDNLLFLNSKICINYIPTNKIGLIKSLKNKKSSQYYENIWYCKKSFLTHNSFLVVQEDKSEYNSSSENYSSKISKNYFKCFLYYKLGKFYGDSLPSKKSNLLKTNFSTININRPVLRKAKQGYQNTTKCFLFVSLLNEFSLPKKRDLIKQWNGMKKLDNTYLTNSPLFTKQESSIFQKHKKLRKIFQLIISGSRGWFCSKNIFKLLINLNSPVFFKKVNQSYLLENYIKNHKIPVIGLNIFLYNFISLPENVCFYFEIFENKWVTPNNKLTTGFIRITKDGEFRRFRSKKNNSVACILTRQDLITLDLSKFINTRNDTKNFNKNKQVRIGTILRSGTEIVPGIASSTGGFILNKKFTQFTIRLGIPFLASARGIIHVFQNDLIQKNDLLVTLKSRRLQTEDIVQGIPKIEQLFEARETQGGAIIRNSVHTRLKKYFLSSLKSEKVSINNIHNNLSKAITDSLNKIQFFLVQSILQAYSSQGVKISQKHIEIIVRQMTTRVRILSGGDSGLLPGELIQFTRIKKLNDKLCSLGKRPAIYEPIILGITKSVLQSESFLLSASFQEVSRVLVRSALNKKTDFLRGLHENVILGQLVPTGTGLVSNNTKIIQK